MWTTCLSMFSFTIIITIIIIHNIIILVTWCIWRRFSMIFSQTVDLPEAVPPATPMRKGARRVLCSLSPAMVLLLLLCFSMNITRLASYARLWAGSVHLKYEAGR